MARGIRLYSEWLGCEIVELNVQPDHVPVIMSIPPKVSVSAYMGTIKGKTAIKIFKSYLMLKKRPHWGNHLWGKGYFLNTIGLNGEVIKRYVKYQEEEERRGEQTARIFNYGYVLWNSKPDGLNFFQLPAYAILSRFI